MYLSGPTEIAVADYKGVQYIILSDLHFSKTGSCSRCEEGCIRIPDWLTKRFNQAYEKNYWIDFYLERFYTPPDIRVSRYLIGKTRDWISDIELTFNHCFHHVDCPYKTTRFHAIDIRTYYTGSKSYSIPVNIFLQHLVQDLTHHTRHDVNLLFEELFGKGLLIDLTRLIFTSDNFLEEVELLFTPLLNQLGPKLRKEFFQSIMSERLVSKKQHRVRKQLYQLRLEGQSELADQILSFIRKEGQREWEEYNPILLWRKYYRQPSEKLQEEIITRLISYGTNWIDGYTLARMFRHFNKNHIPSLERIYYGGAYHARQLVKFFSEVLKTKVAIYSHYEKDLRCVKLPDYLRL